MNEQIKNPVSKQEVNKERVYIAIDLKSFYASVECKERGLDPLTTNLVVADASRTEKTICLAVSPSLKAYKISGRARLFEVVQRVEEVNRERKSRIKDGVFKGESYSDVELKNYPDYKLSYITATPRMALYLKYSADIYDIYLQYVAPEDIHVYSIDEVMMDVTAYLDVYKKTPKQLASDMIREILEKTGITATAGIGTNLYLCKVAMDIVAKHIPEDENGVRIAYLDEMSYRKILWGHRPLTDFWRVGRGYAKKLEECGLFTMGDIARCSLGKPNDFHNEDLLYKLFGINAELLIDHAWGYEPCTMEEIKNYRPEATSVGSGQVLQHPYTFEKARLIVREMTDLLVLDLVKKKLTTDQLVLTVGYDIENLENAKIRDTYKGEIKIDYYGRKTPKHAHGTANLKKYTSSTQIILDAVTELYNNIVDPNLLVRRINIVANRVLSDEEAADRNSCEQLDLFSLGLTQGNAGVDGHSGIPASAEQKTKKQEKQLAKEKNIQQAILQIQDRYGKNALIKGMNLEEGAMTVERNRQIGGHKA